MGVSALIGSHARMVSTFGHMKAAPLSPVWSVYPMSVYLGGGLPRPIILRRRSWEVMIKDNKVKLTREYCLRKMKVWRMLEKRKG